MKGHFEGEIWGVELIESEGKVVTCADDNQIMVFDYANKAFDRKGTVSDHKSTNAAKIKAVTASSQSIYPANQQARAVAFSKKHNHLVVCSNMGKVSVRDFADLDTKKASLKDATEWCEVARYSPCGNFLAIGTHDDKVNVYTVSDAGEYALHKSFTQHASFITALDWSQDSTYIRSVDGGYEKLFWNVADKAIDAAGLSNTKNMQWDTSTVKINWDSIGVTPSGEDGTHINAVAASRDRSLLVSVDDWGLVNVFNYPVSDPQAKAVSYAGHSEHVVRVAITDDNARMFTVGGQDKALIQWKRK